MKKLTLLGAVAFLFYGTTVSAQSSTATTNSTGGVQFLGFNGGGGGGPKDLDIRNNFNRPIKMFTNSTQRMHINQNRNSAIGGILGGFNVVTDGYVGIGPNTGNIWTTKGPFSLLHLNGGQVGALGSVQELGFRPWMQTGISFTGFNDFAYVGYRHVTGNTNEFVINWSNDPAVVAGPDDMVFRFTQGYDFTAPNPDDPLARIDNNFTASDDMDGRHIARFTPTGEFGLGPNFGHTFDNTAYVRPQSMLHMSSYQQQDAWMQVTNQTGTAETANDGLRIGVTGTGTAHIKQQEELPLILYTGATELMRLIPANTSTSTPAMVGIGNFSTTTPYIGAKLDIDGDLRIRTVTQDNALTQVLVIDPNDHNRVHWRAISSIGGGGTGGTVTADNGLRIFPTNSGNVQLGQANTGGTALTGGELLDDREIPLNGHSLFFSTNGRIGIGTFSSSKLTIRNDATPTPWTNILLLRNSLGGTTLSVAESGRTIINSSDAEALGVNFNAITGSSVVNTRTYTIIEPSFSGSSVTGVRAGFEINDDFAGTEMGFSSAPTGTKADNYGYHVLINAGTNKTNKGLTGTVRNGKENYGIDLDVFDGSLSTYGIDVKVGANSVAADNQNATNYGVNSWAVGGVITYGGKFHASGASSKNYGIYSSVSGGPSGNNPPQPTQQNFAGYFAGEVYISGTFGPSDIMLKDNVINIDNATELINQLQPKTFNYKQADFPNMNLSSGLQYGLIAQDVETILPDLITEVTQPAELDSLGNVVTPEINFKGLEYQQLIPILIAGFKEQQSELDTKDSLIDNLQSEINYIKECLLNARICEEGNRTINQNLTTETNKKTIELINTNSIILDQNLPNPFAEHTVINYNIPTDVTEAKLLFYDLNGRIIKELLIEERGESKLTVYGTNLKTGVYTYSLIADGELIATKKMVKK